MKNACAKIFLTLRRDVALSLRGAESYGVAGFFVIVALLFSFAPGMDAQGLASFAPGVIAVGVLLAMLLPLESLYHRDAEDGTLDLFLCAGLRPLSYVLAKISAHIVIALAPLLVSALIVALMYGVAGKAVGALLSSVALAGIYAALHGGFCACLSLGARRPGLVLAVIALPLSLPMLVLTSAAVGAALADLPATPYLLLQLALLAAAFPLLLAAAAAALRMHRFSS